MKKPKFRVGDVVEEVTVRRFTIGRIGNYYGEVLYCIDDDLDPGVIGDKNLRLVRRGKR